MIHEILKRCWKNYRADLYPIDRRMADWKIKGMNTENIRFLINEICAQFTADDCYMEIGSYQGSSLVAAAYRNKIQCIGVDNFSLFDKDGDNKKKLQENIFGYDILFINADFDALSDNPSFDNNIKVFYYDGSHTYEDTMQGLSFGNMVTVEDSIIMIDDYSNGGVYDACQDFLKNSRFKPVMEIRHDKSKQCFCSKWHNGFLILAAGKYIK